MTNSYTEKLFKILEQIRKILKSSDKIYTQEYFAEEVCKISRFQYLRYLNGKSIISYEDGKKLEKFVKNFKENFKNKAE